MKKHLHLILWLLPFAAIGQIPPGYYSSAAGYTGDALRLQLSYIVRPHTQLTYTPGLWNAYRTTDVKPNGKLWDMYSDIPGGTPPYEYTIGSDQCSSTTPSAEGTCYNREHTWPQSKFSSDTPMQTDLFHVIPADYVVNGMRGDLPYGKAGSSVSYTCQNGSKIANNSYPGAPSGNCYEPLDSFKGDIARIYFYMSTCYMNDSIRFAGWEMAYNSRLKPWAIQMLLDWHHNDPVSTKEINRNNAAYALQRNRNPFVDHPEYADCIWGAGPCTNEVGDIAEVPSEFSAWYSTATHQITFTSTTTANITSLSIVDASGRKIYTAQPASTAQPVDASLYAPGLYIVVATGARQVMTQKVVVY